MEGYYKVCLCGLSLGEIGLALLLGLLQRSGTSCLEPERLYTSWSFHSLTVRGSVRCVISALAPVMGETWNPAERPAPVPYTG